MVMDLVPAMLILAAFLSVLGIALAVVAYVRVDALFKEAETRSELRRGGGGDGRDDVAA